MKAGSSAGTETERRFLVRVAAWEEAAEAASREQLIQAYLSAEVERTVRIRVGADSGRLTVKGPSTGGSRTEIECEIPRETVLAILDARLYSGEPVEKTRSTLRVGRLVWEIDQFEGRNAGLVIAEVEHDEDGGSRSAWEDDVDRALPAWVGREITGDSRFSNSSLARRPFSSWPEAEQEEVLAEISS